MSERDPLFVENEALRAQAERVKAIAELGVREQWPPDEWRAALLSSSEPVTAGPEHVPACNNVCEGEAHTFRCDQCGALPGECTNQDTGEEWGDCYNPRPAGEATPPAEQRCSACGRPMSAQGCHGGPGWGWSHPVAPARPTTEGGQP